LHAILYLCLLLRCYIATLVIALFLAFVAYPLLHYSCYSFALPSLLHSALLTILSPYLVVFFRITCPFSFFVLFFANLLWCYFCSTAHCTLGLCSTYP